jgi:hypothetical protein
VAVVGGIESLFYMQRQLERYGISANLVASVMDADCDAISEISLQLMEKIIETRKLTKAGKSQLIRRGLAIPDKLGSRLIKSTIQGRRRGRQRRDSFAPACRSGLRCGGSP